MGEGAQERKKWKDVRVFDASNLEEWLEQSIPGQAWFANEIGLPSEGVRSLEACWQEWLADCAPPLSPELFVPAIEGFRPSAKKKLLSAPGEPLIVAADSTLEALAFLHCLFSQNDSELSHLRDRVIVFDKPGQLTKLASQSPHFVAVTANREVEKEIAQHAKNLRSIILYPRSAINNEPDIALEPLTYEPFNKALKSMGCNDDEISRLTHESGRSLTILRRRLSKTRAIQTPYWASDQGTARSLVPFAFAGAWKTRNDADKVIMELLSGQFSYAELEQQIAALQQLEDSPIWSAGSLHGLVSKIDVMFAISKDITEPDIQRFLNVAKLVLSEDDPSLDLPEDQRWAAGMYGKSRDISSALRDGICETLVLLAVYGNQILKNRLGVDLEVRVGHLIEELFTPLTIRTLEASSGDLPMYAEAAPKVFLNILERDLESAEPQSLLLMRPVNTGLFGRCYRSGLLWALEGLAWSEEYLVSTVLILGRLAQQEIDDNIMNKPSASLSSIFRCWMPQTAVSIEIRIKVLELLAQKFPDVAWKICVEQFDGNSRTGHYSHKPRWRTDGHGYGEPVTRGEASKFALHALNMTIAWKNHNRETLADLVGCLRWLDKEDQDKIWDLVEQWSKQASDEDKSWMREKIRMSAFTRRGLKHGKAGKDLNRARTLYESLMPSDVILKHEWLFLKHWIEESADELEEDEMDFKKRDERILAMRTEALAEILAARGMQGALKLAEKGEAANLIGWIIARIYENPTDFVQAIRFVLDRGPLSESSSRRFLTYGALSSLPEDRALKIIPELLKHLHDSELVPVLTLCPFNNSTWNELRGLDDEVQNGYWRDVPASWSHNTSEELQYAVDKLIEAKRPRTAFHLIRFDMEKIQPKQMVKLMRAIGADDDEPTDCYKLESYAIRDVFERLNRSGEIAVDDLAALEFKYIDVFDTEDSHIPNLENQIEKNPEMYVHAVVFAYKRDDGGEDPKGLQANDEEHKENRAVAAYKLLERLARIPGHNKDGEQDSGEIVKWVRQVQAGCKELARGKIGDHALGKLFSTAPAGDDGIWPCKPVRDALEQVLNEEMSDSLKTALYNKRGVHWRGEGGDEERRLASEFQQWVSALQFTHPKIAKVLSRLVKTYQHEAEWQDTEAVARRRLRS
ncbi:putative addiction module [Micavibrio aeruginosavorus ARL-13]|uniref:Putative addiction module n=1 Tax=Micavibrio aeruginosavorus (strain ARL-13) TaxID=856793 RepID=G2KQZ8_MICAA|nr:putative addiction module [Micavibrio aeruginosavorus ARL-13]